jgi:O-antigen biosynthesis protein
MPLVRAQLPGTVLHIVGSHPTPAVEALAGEFVQVHGWVPSVAPLYASARVAVAPLRFGAGVKGKVGESLSLGVPTVGTPLAFEGIRLQPGRDVLVGETAAELAEAIVRALADDALWRRLSSNGRSVVAAQFGPSVAREVLAGVLELAPRTGV